MRFKPLKYLAFVLGGVSTAVATGALYLYATFDGARLAADLSHFTKQRYQRSLRFDGPLELAMFPRLALRVPAATLSGRNGDGEFLGVDAAALGLRLLPLLARRVVVDRVDADGLRVDLRRGKDGRLNAADLFAEGADDTPVELALTRVGVSRGTLTWIDERSGRSFGLAELHFASGGLARRANGHLELAARLIQAAPAVDARVEVETDYRLDADADPQARDLRVVVRGMVAGRPDVELGLTVAELDVAADGPPQLAGVGLLAKGKADGGTLELRATAPHLTLAAAGPEAASAEATLRVEGQGHGGQLRARLTKVRGQDSRLMADSVSGEVDWKGAAGRLTGHLGGPASWQGEPRVVDLPALGGEFDFTPSRSGAAALRLTLQAAARVDVGRNSAAGRFDLRTGDSRIHGGWSLPRLAPLAVGFDLDVDRLDVDSAAGAAAPRVDLAALHGVDADGVLRVGSLKVAGLHLERLRVPLAVHGGRLNATGWSASLYGGSADGSLSLAADGNRLAVRGTLQNVGLAPLLHGAIGREALGGSASLAFDLGAAGTTADELRRSLTGTASLRLRNGVLPGVDAVALLKEWRGAIAARQPARRPFHDNESTPLGDVAVSFQVGGGRARFADLFGRSAAIGLNGFGEIDLASGVIDAVPRWTLLAVAPADQPQLGSLRGVTVPMRATGPAGRLDWLLDANLPAPPARR